MSELDDIRARRAAISEGVLSLHASEHYDISLYREGTPYPVACFEYQADADFFTAAPADIDTLIAEVERLQAQLASVSHNYEYVRQRAPWGALTRLATYGAQNYDYSTDARQVQDYCDDFHPNAQPQA